MEQTRNNSVVSLHLSHVLDGAGVSERIIKQRRLTFLKKELVANFHSQLNGYGNTTYWVGSQIEGSTTFGLHSDIDAIHHQHDVTAIQSMRERKQGKVNCLVLQGGAIPAGYCRLQLLLRYEPMPDDNLTYDDKGRVLLKHKALRLPPGIIMHGPAATKLGFEGNCDTDFVYGIKCDSISKQVKPWIRRMKNKQWPTSDMLETATESGFFLVPVGHRLSATPDVEWRVSPSLTERCLMFGMNITQMKCYAILKMIKKDLIIPNIGESITSFHLKTVLFHCVEDTPTELWRGDNLIACIDVCLKYLLVCVQKRSCPNFLIPEDNLFIGRISEEKIPHLKKLLHELIKSDGSYLFTITCDQIGAVLNACLNSPSTIHPEWFILGEANQLGWCETLPIYFTQSCYESPLQNLSDNQFQERIVKLRNIQDCSDSDTKSVATSFLQLLYSGYGSVLASRCIREGIGLSKGVLSVLELGCGFDLMSGRLKKASALYCSGQYTEAASVLEDLDSRYDFRFVQPVCVCKSNLAAALKRGFIRRIFFDNKNNMLTACHVAFKTREIDCCPLALRFDMFRGIGDDRALRNPAADTWMDMAAVDSVIFLYFLMYLTYGSMGNRRLQLHAINNLIRSLGTNGEYLYIRHYETAFNLLGQCYEMEVMPSDALLCYQLSLQRMPRNNSASWLVALLIYKHFSRQLLGIYKSLYLIS